MKEVRLYEIHEYSNVIDRIKRHQGYHNLRHRIAIYEWYYLNLVLSRDDTIISFLEENSATEIGKEDYVRYEIKNRSQKFDFKFGGEGLLDLFEP